MTTTTHSRDAGPAGTVFRCMLAVAMIAATAFGSVADAASASCAAEGKVPQSLRIGAAENGGGPGIATLGWGGGGSQLKLLDERILEGDCLASVTGFAGEDIWLKGNLAVRLGEAGEISAARAIPRQPSLPPMNQEVDDGDDHSHSDSGLGEFITGTRIAVKRSPQGLIEYFVGVWKGPTILVAVFARSPGGIMSPAAPLLRSQLPIRGISYVPGEDALSGTLGITQEAPGALRLVNVMWSHQDFTK